MATKLARLTSAEIRARLDHPVVDGDGHTMEFNPVFLDYLKQVAGADEVKRYETNAGKSGTRWYGLSTEERNLRRVRRPPFWMLPASNTLDRATAMLPALMGQRMDEFGIDFSIVYTTYLHCPHLRDDKLRRATCRALNLMHADMFRGHGDRMTPAAVIPTYSPEEAIAELDFAVGELGLKAAQIEGGVPRPVPAIKAVAPELAHEGPWLDPLAMGEAHDYDPFWARCVELGVAPTTHASGQGLGHRNATHSYVYNHIGAFDANGEAFAKALVLGGVTRRFPSLKFGFLEGGSGWACLLYNAFIEHWEKRNTKRLRAELDPVLVDRDRMADMFAEFGGKLFTPYLDYARQHGGNAMYTEDAADIDDWAACEVETAEDLRDLFVPNFYFGAEAEDRATRGALTGAANHMGARLKAFFSSDISHWDVPEMNQVVMEAYEMVEDGALDDAQFRAFMFTNPVELFGGMNHDFFNGTVVEDAATRLFADQDAAAAE